MKRCFLIVGHGSRNPAANRECLNFVETYRGRHPEKDIQLTYIELAEPLLADSLEACGKNYDEVVVAPLFLFAAGHVKHEIPAAVAKARKKYPAVRFTITDIIGVEKAMARSLQEQVEKADTRLPLEASRYVVLVVGRGSSDLEANGDFYKLVRYFEEGKGYRLVLPTFIGITTPLVAHSLDIIAHLRAERLIVVPYMIFAGVLVDRLKTRVAEFQKRHPDIDTCLAPPIGDYPPLYDILNTRITTVSENKALSK
jgi:sirohydrochlorin ferrochelatase